MLNELKNKESIGNTEATDLLLNFFRPTKEKLPDSKLYTKAEN